MATYAVNLDKMLQTGTQMDIDGENSTVIETIMSTAVVAVKILILI